MQKILILLIVCITFNAASIAQTVGAPAKKADKKMKILLPVKPTDSVKVIPLPKSLIKKPVIETETPKTAGANTPVILKKDSVFSRKLKKYKANI